jgi:cell division initiation protein
MKITPLEIRQKSFEKAFRGLDKDEVQAFLLTLSQQWEKLNDENKELKVKLEHANHELQKMREVETSLYKTLKTAEDTGNSMVEQATKSAELKVREAQLKADELLNEARQKARTIVDDAFKQCDKVISEMQSEVKGLEQEHQRLEGFLDTLVRDLQNLANDALDKVEKTKSKPKASSNSIVSRAGNIKPKELENDRFLREMNTTSAITVGAAAAPAGHAPIQNQLSGQPVKQTTIDPPGTGDPFRQPMPDPYTPGPNPTPDVDQPGPEIPNPVTPMPDVPAPEIEQPSPDIPEIPGSPEIEQPSPEIQPMPSQPEVQPPLSGRRPAPAVAATQPAGGSFFDEIQ